MFVKKVFVQLNICTFYFPAVFKEIRLLYNYSIQNTYNVKKIGKPVSEFQVPTQCQTPWALGFNWDFSDQEFRLQVCQ